MLQLINDLKNNELKRFQLIYGDERYLVRYYKNALISRLSSADDEMNRTIFRGKDIEASQIAEAAQVLPFFAERRLIVVEDSGFFEKSSDMLDYLESFPDTTYIVFVEHKVDSRNRLFKWMNKNQEGTVTECKTQNGKNLESWIGNYVKREGKTMSVSQIELLIERVGTDMETLSNELDKLIGYVGERTVIEKEDIEAVSSGLAVSKIFDMFDAVAEKKKDRALSLYNDIMAGKESPNSLLYKFTRHINILLQTQECLSLGMNKYEIATKCGVPNFTVAKYSRQARSFKRSELLNMLENRIELEEMQKTGRLSEQISVELFFIQALTNC